MTRTDSIRRRQVLRGGSALAALAALGAAGCDDVAFGIAGAAGGEEGPFGLPSSLAFDPDFHLLCRAGWAPAPGEWERVRRMGREAWLDEQLAPESIDDSACAWRTSVCELADDDPQELGGVQERFVDRDLQRVALLRAVHSRRRLFESMCAFWTDHFSIQVGKKGCTRTKPLDDRAVIRRHALGSFREMVRASAASGAMLAYLDGAENRVSAPGDRPNENYARELLELHTLGVRGGYTQRDVMEAARCLTGWTIERRGGLGNLRRRDEVVFRREHHDDGAKSVLGATIPAGGGAADLDRLVEIVCAHPSTATHVATKLCRRFVRDPPPASLVHRLAAEFRRTGGGIAGVVRMLFTSDEFAASAGRRVRRPFEFVVAALRVTGTDARGGPEELRALERLGHVPHHYPTPDGYPIEAEPWMGTLLWRWNFALALTTGRLGKTRPDFAALRRRAGIAADAPAADLAPLFLGRAASPEERELVRAFETGASGPRDAVSAEAAALILCSPAFQVD
ncbi:MAG: hypothetical protein HMLKMBBP_01102 [Planctomycetes bacterium]|nr:hypothetical protein [Planctomycetota bacterium]